MRDEVEARGQDQKHRGVACSMHEPQSWEWARVQKAKLHTVSKPCSQNCISRVNRQVRALGRRVAAVVQLGRTQTVRRRGLPVRGGRRRLRRHCGSLSPYLPKWHSCPAAKSKQTRCPLGGWAAEAAECTRRCGCPCSEPFGRSSSTLSSKCCFLDYCPFPLSP